MSKRIPTMRTILILLLATDELSSTRNDHRRCHALSLVVVTDQRPLLREFGLGINRRVRNSEGGGESRGSMWRLHLRRDHTVPRHALRE